MNSGVNKNLLSSKLSDMESFVDNNLIEFNNKLKNLSMVDDYVKQLILDYKSIYTLTLEINWLIKEFDLIEKELDIKNIDILKKVNSILFEKEYTHKHKLNKLFNDLQNLDPFFSSYTEDTIIQIQNMLSNYINVKDYDLFVKSDLNLLKNSLSFYANETEYKLSTYDTEFKSAKVNSLNDQEVYFNINLLESLYNASKYDINRRIKTKVDDLNQGLYMVKFNSIKGQVTKSNNEKENKMCLVYKYIKYNDIFTKSLVHYIEEVHKTSIIVLNENPTMFFLDERFKTYSKWDNESNKEFIATNVMNSIRNKNKTETLLLLSQYGPYYYNEKKLYETLHSIALTKIWQDDRLNEDLKFIQKKIKSTKEWNEKIIFNIVFILKDLSKFIKIIRDSNINISAGPQKKRGMMNYLELDLSHIDENFRTSMYNNYRKTIDNSSIYNINLTKKHFSAKNIHMNLGSIRWYTTLKNSTKNKNEFKPEDFRGYLSDKSINKDFELYDVFRDIIENEPLNNHTQRKIENILIDHNIWKIKDSNDKEIFNIIGRLNTDSKTQQTKIDEDLRSLITNFINRKLSVKYKSKRLTKKEMSTFYLSTILSTVSIDFVISIMLGQCYMIINSTNDEIENSTAEVFTRLGKHLVNNYFYTLYIKENKIKGKEFSTYSNWDWRRDNEEYIEKFDNVILHSLGALLIEWLRDLDILDVTSIKSKQDSKKRISIVFATKKFKNMTKLNKPFILPNKIPMIVRPKEYKRIAKGKGSYSESLGGYLLNGDYYSNEIIIRNWRSKEHSTIKDINSIYKSINNISSVGYKVNKDVLNFIRLNDSKFNLTMLNCLHDLEQKKLDNVKLSKWEKLELDSFTSKKRVQNIIIKLADVFENVPEFYIPVRLDYRGRMYCEPDYLNYQGTELAKSLLMFSKGEKVLKSDSGSINYLKIYGANCFGNKLEKKSLVERIKWVDENIDNIRNYHNGELLSKAESKFLFISFCIEFNRWLDCLQNSDTIYFVTYLPIQLDASCNGYQHICMLVKDMELAKHLNMTVSSYKDIPQDFYGLISRYLHEYYISELKKDDKCVNKDKKLSMDDRKSYERLSDLEIKRNVIKKSVMTIPYNASSITTLEYLRENFEYDIENNKIFKIDNDLTSGDLEEVAKDKNIENTNFTHSKSNKKFMFIWYKNKENPDIKLQLMDFLNIYKGLTYVLKNIFPSLLSLSKYFKDIAYICTRLGISIPWYLPTGLVVNQSYLEIKETRVKPLNFSNATFSLKVTKDKFDITKQSKALMPNIIHSLDSTTLVMLLDKYFSEFKSETKNIYAVHDCFAVPCNHMDYIVNTLKIVYISIYSDKGYLSKLNDDLIKYLKNHLGEDFSSKDLVIILPPIKTKKNSKCEKVKFPDINLVLKNTYNIKSVIKSSYIIN